jgi:hypothetical protein
MQASVPAIGFSILIFIWCVLVLPIMFIQDGNWAWDLRIRVPSLILTFTNWEYRPHQEVISNHVFSGVEITNRLRIEERIQRVLFNDSLVPFVARIRLKFQVAAPVFSLSKSHPERKLFIILADEFLLNAGNTVKYNILDQNRMMIGPSFRVSDHLDIALLYSYQFGTTTKPNVFKQDHVLWLTLSHKFDLKEEGQGRPLIHKDVGRVGKR